MKVINVSFTEAEFSNLIDSLWQGIDHRDVEIKNHETSFSRRRVLLGQNKVSHNIYKRLLGLLNKESEKPESSNEELKKVLYSK